jgi:L-lactate dehydrogenase (cytochrome)
VYDVTDFLVRHPGGANVILQNAGRDATYVLRFFIRPLRLTLCRKIFASLHPPGTLALLDTNAHIGPVDPATIPAASERVTDEERRIAAVRAALPPPEAALNLHDIEVCLLNAYALRAMARGG